MSEEQKVESKNEDEQIDDKAENENKEQTKGYAFQTKRIIMKPNTYPKNWRTSSPPKE